MDLTIQSLVQSPFMRAMAVVPTKSEELVHGIHDHLPPLVKTQVVVPYVRNPGISGRWVFNIPRRGMWHSAVLVIRPRGYVDIPNGMLARSYTHCGTFLEAVEDIQLFSKGRFVERLIPAAITNEMAHYADPTFLVYQHTYAQWNYTSDAATNNDTAWPHITYPEVIGSLGSTQEDRKRPQYHIPLPLACFSSLKKNFQTLFVENLSLVVTTKQFGFVSALTGYDMELRCEFHSFHPNVETVIRNANYKQNIPATLPWHDWIEFDNRITQSNNVVEYSLESDALVSTLIVLPQWKFTARDVRFANIHQNFYIVIRSLSEVLFEGSVAEMKTKYDLILDETDATAQGTNMTGIDKSQKYYIPICFGLRRDKERFTGGLALSSITNPRISIYANESVYRGDTSTHQFITSANYEALDFKIIGKRHFFLRIDSDTGVISRSIES